MSTEPLDAATTHPRMMMAAHGCYKEDDNLDEMIDDDDVDFDDEDTNIDDNTSTRTSTTLFTSTTTRRLTNAKVREIFEYLYHPPTSNNSNDVAVPKIPIPFTIVPVNSNGKALSPPSYEFECTLYVSRGLSF